MCRSGWRPADLGDLYLNRIEPVARQKRLVFRASERAERYGWFVFAALGLGLAGSWPGHAQARAARGSVAAPRGTGRPGRRWPRVRQRRKPGANPAAMTAAEAVEAGRTAYGAGRWAEALAAFELAVAIEPKAAVPRYDVAATLFQMERYRGCGRCIRPGPAERPVRCCGRRSTMRWGTRLLHWGMSTRRSRITTRAWPRRPRAPISMPSAATQPSIGASPWSRPSGALRRRGPRTGRQARPGRARRARTGRTRVPLTGGLRRWLAVARARTGGAGTPGKWRGRRERVGAARGRLARRSA